MKPKTTNRIVQLDKKELQSYKKVAPETYKKLLAQEKQITLINKAESKYEETNNISDLIEFWENVFQNGGLLFDSMAWSFRLVDLYISTKDYEKAYRALDYIVDNMYNTKKQKYKERIIKKLSQKQ